VGGTTTLTGTTTTARINGTRITGQVLISSGALEVSGLSQLASVNSSGSIIATGTVQGGNLTTNGLLSVGGNANVSGTVNFTGFREKVTDAAAPTTIAPDAATGTVYRYTAFSNFTFNGFTNPLAGQSMTVIIVQDGTGSRTMSSTMRFAGGIKTLSTGAGAVDMIGVLFDGTDYLASLIKGYA
jgi:hypothetical protein